MGRWDGFNVVWVRKLRQRKEERKQASGDKQHDVYKFWIFLSDADSVLLDVSDTLMASKQVSSFVDVWSRNSSETGELGNRS